MEQNLHDLHCKEMAIMSERRLKYGKGNIQKHGLIGVLVRMDDKMARLENQFFDKDGNPKQNVYGVDFSDESLRDTLMDIANYSNIALMLLDGTWGADSEAERNG